MSLSSQRIFIGGLVVAALIGGLVLVGTRSRPSLRAVQIDQLLAQMTLAEKVGQMVMVGMDGLKPGHDVQTLVGTEHVGGIILFAKNIQDTHQTTSLTYKLQELALRSGARIPLFISTDQEGGLVGRVRGATTFPGNMALGATLDPSLTREIGQTIGHELKTIGINMNFAPVVDVNNNPQNPVIGIRSFGEDPKRVAELSSAMVRGFQDAGIAATVKHFPGHGDTSIDSHIALPTVPYPLERLNQVELVPFKAAIKAGVKAVMTAHVTFPAVDSTPGLPATLSHAVLTDLLRTQLDFRGLIITDALEMGAVANNFGIVSAAVKAVQAGADIVLVAWPPSRTTTRAVVQALTQAAKDGTIPSEKINQSVRRILETKRSLGLFDAAQTPPGEVDKTIATETSQQLALTAARNSVTIVKNTDSVLPLRNSQKLLVVTPRITALTGVETGGRTHQTALGDSFRRYSQSVSEVMVSLKPTAAQRADVRSQLAQRDIAVVATYRAWRSEYASQAKLVQELMSTGKPVIVVALREPYDLVRFPTVQAYVAAYGFTDPTLTAIGDILLAKAKPQGRLPVRIPNLYPLGHGLSYERRL